MKKNPARILSAALALIMALSLAACGKPENEQDSGSAEENTFVPVSMIAYPVEKQEFDEKGTLIMEHSLDTVEFTGGGPGAAANMTRIYNETFTLPAQEYIYNEEIPFTTEMIYEYFDGTGNSSYHQTAAEMRSDETMYVVRVATDTYTVGAPHGNYFYQTLCFDPADGKVISLKDIGVNGADPTEELVYLISEKYINEYKEDTPGFIEGLSDAVEIFGSMLADGMNQWYLTDDFIVICNPYDVAPYAAGDFEIALSPEELEGIVDAKWFAEPAPEPNTRIYMDKSDAEEFDMVYTVGNYGYEKNLVWFDCDVTNAYLTAVEYTEDGSFIGTTTLDAFAELKAGEALLLDIMVPEGIPDTALCAEIDGRYYTWIIGYNGRDGGITFMEEVLQPAG